MSAGSALIYNLFLWARRLHCSRCIERITERLQGLAVPAASDNGQIIMPCVVNPERSLRFVGRREQTDAMPEGYHFILPAMNHQHRAMHLLDLIDAPKFVERQNGNARDDAKGS